MTPAMSLRIRSNAGMPPRRATGERTMFRSSRGPVSWSRGVLANPRPLRRAQLSRLPSPLRAGDRRLRARRQTSYSLRRPNKRRAAASSTFGVALPRRRVCVLASLGPPQLRIVFIYEPLTTRGVCWSHRQRDLVVTARGLPSRKPSASKAWPSPTHCSPHHGPASDPLLPALVKPTTDGYTPGEYELGRDIGKRRCRGRRVSCLQAATRGRLTAGGSPIGPHSTEGGEHET
jgi:hypothetical protein